MKKFTELSFKSCYESGIDDIVADFYEPALDISCRYDRLAGFFSSSSLAVAARGMAGFINNGGYMRIVCSPKLNPQDVDIIQKLYKDSPDITAEDLGIDLNNLEEGFESNHVKALGWLLANNRLEMRLAIKVRNGETDQEVIENSKNGIFHQKVGILEDNAGNKLSFSGSINESATAWLENDEEFKVFKNWDNTKGYYESDAARFEDIWNGTRGNIKVVNLPTAVKESLINASKDFDIDTISLKKYIKNKKASTFDSSISLFDYQSEALAKWKGNAYSMLFEMATGTGKTRTAIAGVKHLLDINKKLIVIISTPQNTLSNQWMNEIKSLGVTADEMSLIDGTVQKWRDKLCGMLLRIKAGLDNSCIILTTHNTASSEKFTSALKQHRNAHTEVLFVGDEVHWLGASQLRKALLPDYKYRIGLSATPSRWFDDEGTKLLVEYFGNVSFQFTIREALLNVNPITGLHFLVNYYYYIEHVSLTEEETEEYVKLTKSIIALFGKKDIPEVETRLERLIEARANVIKNASNKYEILRGILSKLRKDNALEDLIIFVSPQQIENVMQILNEEGVLFHKLTQEVGTKKDSKFGGLSEREFVINKFKAKDFKALLAIKCLDEGIDIPSACRGILMASSTNPREYVQRIGRIIRQEKDKDFAYLYDICVDSAAGVEYADTEKAIRAKEKIRMEEIAQNAINSFDALQNIVNI